MQEPKELALRMIADILGHMSRELADLRWELEMAGKVDVSSSDGLDEADMKIAELRDLLKQIPID